MTLDRARRAGRSGGNVRVSSSGLAALSRPGHDGAAILAALGGRGGGVCRRDRDGWLLVRVLVYSKLDIHMSRPVAPRKSTAPLARWQVG